jgi:hypothetical protein
MLVNDRTVTHLRQRITGECPGVHEPPYTGTLRLEQQSLGALDVDSVKLFGGPGHGRSEMEDDLYVFRESAQAARVREIP